mmetsp:Transcript_4015/g.4688  ORF Transcript_4015/g.4688 Transcript_4015/m.4688 type:complete len:204 (-) Transcript_4015:225-836(-)
MTAAPMKGRGPHTHISISATTQAVVEVEENDGMGMGGGLKVGIPTLGTRTVECQLELAGTGVPHMDHNFHIGYAHVFDGFIHDGFIHAVHHVILVDSDGGEVLPSLRNRKRDPSTTTVILVCWCCVYGGCVRQPADIELPEIIEVGRGGGLCIVVGNPAKDDYLIVQFHGRMLFPRGRLGEIVWRSRQKVRPLVVYGAVPPEL